MISGTMQALTKLHTVLPPPPLGARKESSNHRPATHCPFTKAYKRVCMAANDRGASEADAALYARYSRALRRFARRTLAPLLGVEADDVLFQAVPVLRCSKPSARASGTLHDDYHANHHQPAELNIWIPLNTCFGANTLFVESARGRRSRARVFGVFSRKGTRVISARIYLTLADFGTTDWCVLARKENRGPCARVPWS